MDRPIRVRIPRVLLIALPLALLAACATPRYESHFRYEAPTDSAGIACVKGCERDLEACKDRCAEAYQACLKTLEPQVEAAYVRALERHVSALDHYRRDLEHYQFQLWLGWHRDPWWFGHGWGGYPWWPSYPTFHASPPSPPTREGVLATLRREHCERDCGCQAPYDACFTACGGRRVEETRCIANCPKAE